MKVFVETAEIVCDEAVARALPPGPGSDMDWHDGILMNFALGIVAAEFALAMQTKRARDAVAKFPDWWIDETTPTVGKVAAGRGGVVVAQVMGRGILLAGKSTELPAAYFPELASALEGFGFDPERLATSFATSMRDWKIALASLRMFA